MGGLAEDRVRTAMQGLVERDSQLIDEVLNGDMPLNELHIEIDDLCLKLLALHSPMAADLRGGHGGDQDQQRSRARRRHGGEHRRSGAAVRVAPAGEEAHRHPADGDDRAEHAARRARLVRARRHAARAARPRRRRRAGFAENSGVPRAAHLHAPGPRPRSSRPSTSFSFRATSSASATMRRTSPRTSSSWCRAATSAITRRTLAGQ